jgi:hypothetical protein
MKTICGCGKKIDAAIPSNFELGSALAGQISGFLGLNWKNGLLFLKGKRQQRK